MTSKKFINKTGNLFVLNTKKNKKFSIKIHILFRDIYFLLEIFSLVSNKKHI